MHDSIADMFIRIKNAQAVKRDSVSMPASGMRENIAKVLQESGYIESYVRRDGAPVDTLEITLQYTDKQPAITHLKRISKPGLRRYSSVEQIPRPLSGHGLVIMSTDTAKICMRTFRTDHGRLCIHCRHGICPEKIRRSANSRAAKHGC